MNVRATIQDIIKDADRMTVTEISVALIEQIFIEQEDNIVDRERFENSDLAKPVLWCGATNLVRNILKKPAVVEAILNEQAELFGEFSKCVYVPNEKGEPYFARRGCLLRQEYEAALNYLRLKRDEIIQKVELYDTQYHRALPFWGPEMTFGDAYAKAVQGR